ncbi:MAG: tyrosine-type recombinase/integrase [Patescibacteria group bacterium]|nr:tyrosine-type recombinase/integrase [Patescibacteria group bacterium]
MRAAGSGTKRADGRWQLLVTLTRPDGTKKRKYVYGASQREAQAAAARLIAENPRRVGRQPKTLEDLMEVYRAERWPAFARGTIEQHRPAYVRILAHFGDVDVRDIGAADVAAWLRRMAQEPKLSGRTVQAYRNVLSSLLGFAEDLGWREGNPAKGRKLPLSAKPRPRNPVSQAELAAVIEKEPSATLKDLWQFLGSTGMRPREALALRGSDLFDAEGLWWVRGGLKTQAGRREVPVAEVLALRLRCADDAPLFQMPGRTVPMRYRWVASKWHEALGRAGIKDTNLYQLRKLALTRWLQAGLPRETIEAMAGHTDIRTTETFYRRTSRARIAETVIAAGVLSVCQSVLAE